MEVKGEKKKEKVRMEQHMIKRPHGTLLFHCISKLIITIFHMSGHIMRSSAFEHVSYDTFFIRISSLIFNYLKS